MRAEVASKPEPLRFATARAFEAWLRKNHAATRSQRIEALVEMLARGEKIHG